MISFFVYVVLNKGATLIKMMRCSSLKIRSKGAFIEKTKGTIVPLSFTTNGMLLDDEVTEFLNQEMYNVVLSLDGRKDVHDRLRETITGKGSYDLKGALTK